MRTRFSLNPESDRQDEAKYWATFSDVALSMLLVLLLFILAQFLNYEQIFVLEEIARRQQDVATRIDSVAAGWEGIDVVVTREDDFHQRVRVTGTDGLVFEPCLDDLTQDGRSLLRQLAETLGASAAYFESVQVEGHTDPLPPTSETCVREGIQDNWQLSARRATEVVRLFSAEGLFPRARLSSVGRGEFHSLSAASDTTLEARRRDRRIEIVLRYSDQGIGGVQADE